MLLRRDEVLDVRDQALVELLRPFVVDVVAEEAVVVGRDDDVAADSLALREPPLHLREVPGVVVDLLVVVDLDPRLLLELLQRRRLVDAGGFERLRRIDVVAASSRSSGPSSAPRSTRAGSPPPPPPPQAASRPGTDSSAAPAAPRRSSSRTGHLLVHSDISSPCSTTKVDSGLQLNVTFEPGAGMRLAGVDVLRENLHRACRRIDDELRRDADVSGLGNLPRKPVLAAALAEA